MVGVLGQVGAGDQDFSGSLACAGGGIWGKGCHRGILLPDWWASINRNH